MLTDAQPRQQAAVIVMRVRVSAREMVRTITPQELLHGGVINGRQYDPVAYNVVGLHRNSAQVDDERRLAAMTQHLSFQRRRGEGINGASLPLWRHPAEAVS